MLTEIENNRIICHHHIWAPLSKLTEKGYGLTKLLFASIVKFSITELKIVFFFQKIIPLMFSKSCFAHGAARKFSPGKLFSVQIERKSFDDQIFVKFLKNVKV